MGWCAICSDILKHHCVCALWPEIGYGSLEDTIFCYQEVRLALQSDIEFCVTSKGWEKNA